MSKLEDILCSHIDTFASTREEVIEHSVEVGRHYTAQVDSGDYYESVYDTTYEKVHHADSHPRAIKEIIKDLNAAPAEINSALFNVWLRVWPDKNSTDKRKSACVNLFTEKLKEYVKEQNWEPLASLPDSQDARQILYALRPIDCRQPSVIGKVRSCLSSTLPDCYAVYNSVLEDSLDVVSYADLAIHCDSIMKDVPNLLRRKFLEAPCPSKVYTSLVDMLEKKVTEKATLFVNKVLTETARVISKEYLEALLSNSAKAGNPADYLSVLITEANKRTNKAPPSLNLPPQFERQEVPESFNWRLRLLCLGGTLAGTYGAFAAAYFQPNSFRISAALAGMLVSKTVFSRIASNMWANKRIELGERNNESQRLHNLARNGELCRYHAEVGEYLRSAFKGSHPVYEKYVAKSQRGG
jgi:hypothetical protein